MLGMSIYKEKFNEEYVKKMIEAGIDKAFISLHIVEELEQKEELVVFLKKLNEYDLDLIVDVSPFTFKNFHKEELKELNINTLRIDFGFSIDEIILIMDDFNIILNASTLTENQIQEFIKKGVDLSKVSLMHNFYPKEETGLSFEYFKELNNKFKEYNFKVISFIPGDNVLRGPIYKGLPTIEEQRYKPFLINFAQLLKYSDEIYIADNEIKEESMKYIKYLNKRIIPIPIKNISLDEKFINIPLTIRQDSNHLNLRIEDSRFDLKTKNPIEPLNCIKREKGFITQDNKLSKRYNGEVMITLTQLNKKENLNVVAQVNNKYEELLDYIIRGEKVIFIEE